jgi:hypothetical protein
MATRYLMVLDVESNGLYGEGFAVATVIFDRSTGEIIKRHLITCPYTTATLGATTKSNYEWVEVNVLPYMPRANISTTCPKEMRDVWYSYYQLYTSRYSNDISIWGDCIYPVEANFLRQVTLDQMWEREWKMPYPIHEIATVRMLAGLHPTASYNLPTNEQHNPVAECSYIVHQLDKWLTQINWEA